MDFLQTFPVIINPTITTFLLAILPIGELRASIPTAIEIYNLSVPWAYIVSLVGNIVPAFFIMLWIDPISNFLRKRFDFMERFFAWLFRRTRRHGARFDRWGPFALLLFVAIPLPMTGVYTGAFAAFLFGISMKQAIPILFSGLAVAGVIVVLMTLGIESLINFF